MAPQKKRRKDKRWAPTSLNKELAQRGAHASPQQRRDAPVGRQPVLEDVVQDLATVLHGEVETAARGALTGL